MLAGEDQGGRTDTPVVTRIDEGGGIDVKAIADLIRDALTARPGKPERCP